MTEGEDSRLNFRHDGTDNEGASPLITPGKDENTKRQRKKTKNNPEEKASVSSPLNGSIRGPRVSKPLDSHLFVTPAIFKPGSILFKGKNMDSRQKISGMTAGGGHP